MNKHNRKKKYERFAEKTVHWYEVVLSKVISAREKVFGCREHETLIANDILSVL